MLTEICKTFAQWAGCGREQKNNLGQALYGLRITRPSLSQATEFHQAFQQCPFSNSIPRSTRLRGDLGMAPQSRHFDKYNFSFSQRKTRSVFCFKKNCKLYFQKASKLCKPASRAREEVHWQAKVAPSENHGRKYNCLSLLAILQTTKGTSIITAKRIRSFKPTIYR